MPIFKINQRLVYFAHVPKAAGTSVANFLNDISDSSAMIFDGQWKQRPVSRWSSTSPQHIPYCHLKELFPDNFFDSNFAVVRHPEERILSEYRFRSQKSALHRLLPFSEWLRIVLCSTKINPFVFDGHMRPQKDFIAPGAKVFKLEEGIENLASWVSKTLELDNITWKYQQHANRSVERHVPLSYEDRQLIEKFYADDYLQFGYETRREPSLRKLTSMRRITADSLGAIAGLLTRMLSWRIPY